MAFKVDTKNMEKFARDLATLSKSQNEIEKPQTIKPILNRIINQAKSRFPSLTGAAKSSMKQGLSGSAAGIIEAGGADVPYWGWLEFGGDIERAKRPYMSQGRYLFPAIKAGGPDIEEAFTQALEKTIESKIGGRS